jgi:hypothetical protein
MPRYLLPGIVDTVGLDRTATATGMLDQYTSFLSDVEDTAAGVISARWQASGGSGGSGEAHEREGDRRMVINHARRTGGRGGAAFAGLVVVSSWTGKLRRGGGGRAAQPPDCRWRAQREGKRMQKVMVKAARGVALFYTSCRAPGRSMGDAKPGRGGRSGGLGALARMKQLTRTGSRPLRIVQESLMRSLGIN